MSVQDSVRQQVMPVFGYHDCNDAVPIVGKVVQAIPLIGSLISLIDLGFVVGVIRVRSRNGQTIQFSTSKRIQIAVRDVIGLIPGVGLALVPIDLVATCIGAVRHRIRNRRSAPHYS